MNKTKLPVTGCKPATGMDETKRDITVPQPPCICNGKCNTCKKKLLREVSR